MSIDTNTPTGSPEIHHTHRNVTGGWLRPAVFGASDGLISNFALLSGVAGAHASAHTISVTGIAGLIAGAFSMAAGEWVSVASQTELVRAEIDIEKHELKHNAVEEERELALMYQAKGLDPQLAREVAKQLSVDPEQAWRTHTREELGVDPDDLPSPWVAAASSMAAFATGAFIPLLPFLLGATNLIMAAVMAAVALFALGAAVSRFTSRSWWFSGLRQLTVGAVAAIVTFGAGAALGTHLS
ncbi:MAG: vacuolar iron transporter family protein [Frankiaceae bacterium]|nr:vacuolar iron transporter family protein [Frankiaceae bacterium]MDQ1715002.1 vacuolar iron transporter family protein [Frankiaceae bacterium]